MDLLEFAVLGLLGIAAATAIGPRLGIAAPLLLTIAGIAASLLHIVPAVEIEPEWILAGVLPPLLYSAAVSMPTMEFRRDFRAISGLSIVLVVLSSGALGLLFSWLIPEIGLAGGIALGAIISPTDAVAISIVKRLGVSARVVALLEGESLLNDATALVLLRSAIAGMAASVSVWGVVGDFLYAVAVAVTIGVVIGALNLRIRARVEDPTVNTVISFTVPFLAAIPAEHLGASGLVAAVAAGLVTGKGAPRFLSPRHRLSDNQNWHTIEMVLEGAVFLIMGLELTSIIEAVQEDHGGIELALGIALLAMLTTVLLRAAYVTPLLAGLQAQSRRSVAVKAAISSIQDRFKASTIDASNQSKEESDFRRKLLSRSSERFRTRLRRMLADIDYFLAKPLGWREGAIVVWAGMRGVVTLAAAQTLPATMPNRSLLILIAFCVAVGSLLLQGGTLPWLIRVLKPAGIDHKALEEEHAQLKRLLNSAAAETLDESEPNEMVHRFREYLAHGNQELSDQLQTLGQLRLAVLDAQRKALLDVRDYGEFSAEALSVALENLDADQISLELKSRSWSA